VNYFLIVSRLEKYKNIDLAIKACNMIKAPLFVVGKGGEEDYLRSIAGPTIKFLGYVPDMVLRELYSNARAFVFPVKSEDFGIVPIEAQAFGCPVIAHRSGGPLETIIEGKTGVFFDDLTPQSLSKVLSQFDHAKFEKGDCIKNASKYTKRRFISKMQSIIREAAGC
jgi:glycosyltransferase involved in cell wall biosynthesis